MKQKKPKNIGWFRRHGASLVLGLIIVSGLFIHAWELGKFPSGIYSDETSIALNAQMIEKFGTDEYGTPFPLFFKAFGEYKNPLYIYTLSGILHFFPLNDTSVRGVSFLFFGGILAVWVLFALGTYQSRWTAVWTTASLILIPWLFLLSRVSFEAISYVFLYILYIAAVAHFLQKKQSTFLGGLLIGVIAGLSWYAYSTARLLVPLSLLGLCMTHLGFSRWRSFAGIALGSALMLLPAFFLLYIQSDALLGRFSELTYVYDTSTTLLNKIWEFGTYYLAYFSPDFHLFTGDRNLRHHIGVGGMSYIVIYILMWCGVGRSIVQGMAQQKRISRFHLFMILELLISPVAASLTEPGHTIRVISMVIPVLYFAGYGLEMFLEKSSRFWFSTALLISSLSLIISGSHYLTQFAYGYPYKSIRYFHTYGMKEAIEKTRALGYSLLNLAPEYYETPVTATYLNTVMEQGVQVTFLPISAYQNFVRTPFCNLTHKLPYRPLTSFDGSEQVPLNPRAPFTLTCYKAK